ncbi:GldG family protein [Desulfonema magnum]|uniref:ABC transporter domain-containing protein n=1 Tax=Desulfonema magnum TaxID=45655 RepID=A0A975BFG1_9BACT|nr:Gldg family protein [Desulfonema magnum]QTA84318.1 putative ABC transporter domain-containing protein [Desulfonema magnum]
MSDKKRGLEKSLFSAGGLVLILVILIFVNIIFAHANLRWDTTEDKLYSLSEGTRKILSELKEDVTIKVFYSKDNVNTPVHIKTYAGRILDFLSEYEHYSNGKVAVEIYNPKPDSEEEDWAVKYGIGGISLPTGEKIYFGLVVMAADQEETIKTLDPTREEHLEYDITRLISRVQSPKKHKVGIISPIPVFGQPQMAFNMQNQGQGQEPWMFVTELKKTYDVEEISMSSDEISDDIDLLILLHPRDAGESLEYAVDQYVLKGGNVVVFADPLSISDATGPQQQPKGSSLDKLFSAWGVSMERGKILVDFDYSTKLRTQNNQVEDNPLWISAQGESFNKEEITTAKLESMLLPMAGVIKKADDNAFEYTSLLKSSKNSSLTESFRVRFGAGHLRRDFKATVEAYDLAVRLRGKFKTAFPDGKPEAEKEDAKDSSDEKEDTAHLTEGEKNAVIIIVADADMLSDSYYMSRQNFLGFNISRVFNDNLNFLLNTTEMLTGSEELVGIRSRGTFERPFIRVQELERKAQARWLSREQELVRKVDETNRKLREFEQKKDKSQKFIMSEEQEAEIQKFQEEKRRINKELKEVRRNLRADIEALGTKVKVVNIALMPLFVSLGGISYALYRRKKSLRIEN